MNPWIEINTDADIQNLLQQYCHFHDSCLVAANYTTGTSVDSAGGMGFGGQEKKELHLFFHSQMVRETLELCFTGVRQFSLAGWQENYSDELSDCHLAFHREFLSPRQDTPLIAWADWHSFDFASIEMLHEPMTSFVIATKLKWRLGELE